MRKVEENMLGMQGIHQVPPVLLRLIRHTYIFVGTSECEFLKCKLVYDLTRYH